MTPREEFDQARKHIALAANMGEGLKTPDIMAMSLAFRAGVKAKACGFYRLSPYYEDDIRSPYWLAGYDGLDFALPGQLTD